MEVSGAPNVGLVLGGGGLTGLAYHAGALLALEQDLGWDPRTATHVVGTSAGAITGALLRRGVPASDLAAMTVGAVPRSTPEAIRHAVETRAPLPPLRLLDVLHRPHFPNLTILREWARHPWQIAPTPALASIVGDGSLDLAFDALGGAESLDDSWTDATLYVCAVRQRDLHRVVFGRNVDAPLGSAVAASCAIPGYFKPVTIDGVDYLDGGVHSATNADLLRRAELDLVVVISPMSGRELPSWGLGPAIRRFARRNAMRELDRVRASGTPSLLLEPDASSCSLMGTDFMSEERLSEVVAAAFLDTGQQLRARESAPLLRAIDVRSVA